MKEVIKVSAVLNSQEGMDLKVERVEVGLVGPKKVTLKDEASTQVTRDPDSDDKVKLDVVSIDRWPSGVYNVIAGSLYSTFDEDSSRLKVFSEMADTLQKEVDERNDWIQKIKDAH